MRPRSRIVALMAAAIALSACADRPITEIPPGESQETSLSFALSTEKEVDLLFVIDNSLSMTELQDALAAQFPKLIEALRNPQLGNKLPNVRIGVISTDVGTGAWAEQTRCSAEGDGGKLLTTPRAAGCPTPKDPWISYTETKGTVQTNIEGGSADPVEQVKESFSCIARLGDSGCGYEQPLESAKRALDPKLNVNPGFLRNDALLAVVIITNEDDCSAKNSQIYDPTAIQFGSSPESRCFFAGTTCREKGENAGVRHDCVPGGTALFPVESYVSFFQGLKAPGRVILAAIAGPTNKVEVLVGSKGPEVDASCRLGRVYAKPAIRVEKLVQAFGEDGQFTQICTNDFGPALKRLGQRIITNIGGLCIPSSPLTATGGLACNQGDEIGPAGASKMSCTQSCLAEADCLVREVTLQAKKDGSVEQVETDIPRCAAEKFQNPADTDCGTTCPCWRLISKPLVCGDNKGLPYGLDVLRRGEAPKGASATVKCATSPFRRDSVEFADIPQC